MTFSFSWSLSQTGTALLGLKQTVAPEPEGQQQYRARKNRCSWRHLASPLPRELVPHLDICIHHPSLPSLCLETCRCRVSLWYLTLLTLAQINLLGGCWTLCHTRQPPPKTSANGEKRMHMCHVRFPRPDLFQQILHVKYFSILNLQVPWAIFTHTVS